MSGQWKWLYHFPWDNVSQIKRSHCHGMFSDLQLKVNSLASTIYRKLWWAWFVTWYYINHGKIKIRFCLKSLSQIIVVQFFWYLHYFLFSYHENYLVFPLINFIFLNFLLECSWFTVLCCFLLYCKLNQLYIYIYPTLF